MDFDGIHILVLDDTGCVILTTTVVVSEALTQSTETYQLLIDKQKKEEKSFVSIKTTRTFSIHNYLLLFLASSNLLELTTHVITYKLSVECKLALEHTTSCKIGVLVSESKKTGKLKAFHIIPDPCRC